MTYQRNMSISARGLLAEQDVLDDALEDEVGDPEIRADDRTGDDDDDGTRQHLALPRPLDLLELRPRLADEGRETAARNTPLERLPPWLGGGRRTNLLTRARARRRCRLLLLVGLLLPPCAALRSRRPGHYLVSRCAVCRPHQRQYLRNSTRSGVFRLDFCDW